MAIDEHQFWTWLARAWPTATFQTIKGCHTGTGKGFLKCVKKFGLDTDNKQAIHMAIYCPLSIAWKPLMECTEPFWFYLLLKNSQILMWNYVTSGYCFTWVTGCYLCLCWLPTYGLVMSGILTSDFLIDYLNTAWETAQLLDWLLYCWTTGLVSLSRRFFRRPNNKMIWLGTLSYPISELVEICGYLRNNDFFVKISQ